MTDGKDISPKYTLSSFEFKDIGGIKHAAIDGLPKEAKWIFLTDENGFGKTSLLKALAKGIYDQRLNIVPRSMISEVLKAQEKESGTSKVEILRDDGLGGFFDGDRICAYGSSRLNRDSEKSKQEENPIKSLFDTETFLRNIEYQLSRWAIKKDNRKDRNGEFATKYEKVTTILKKLLNLQEIEVDFGSDIVYYYEKDELGKGYNKVTLKKLAAGYRSIIMMVGDMILRLFETQPGIYDPAELWGIVIIDELDLHLHPKWQKRLPGLLSEIFPKVQFIASTHSPIPLLGAPEHSVFLKVNRDAENGITVERLEDMEQQISNLLPNTILTSPIFGLREIFPVTHDKDKRIKTEDTYDEIELNQRVADELKEYLGTDKAKELEKLFKPK